jgi:hypothetical protein
MARKVVCSASSSIVTSGCIAEAGFCPKYCTLHVALVIGVDIVEAGSAPSIAHCMWLCSCMCSCSVGHAYILPRRLISGLRKAAGGHVPKILVLEEEHIRHATHMTYN